MFATAESMAAAPDKMEAPAAGRYAVCDYRVRRGGLRFGQRRRTAGIAFTFKINNHQPDASGRVTSMTYKDGNSTNTYTYDPSGHWRGRSRAHKWT
jgi:hypothetical protein